MYELHLYELEMLKPVGNVFCKDRHHYTRIKVKAPKKDFHLDVLTIETTDFRFEQEGLQSSCRCHGVVVCSEVDR